MKKVLVVVLSVLALVVSVIGCVDKPVESNGQKKPSEAETEDVKKESGAKDSVQDVKDDGKTYNIKIANWYAVDHPQNVALNRFKDYK